MIYIDYTRDELGKIVSMEEIDKTHKLYDMMMSGREKMIEHLANYDDQLADLYLEQEINEIPFAHIDRAIRNAS